MHSYSTRMGITHQLNKHAERVQRHQFQLRLRSVFLCVQYMQWGGREGLVCVDATAILLL